MNKTLVFISDCKKSKDLEMKLNKLNIKYKKVDNLELMFEEKENSGLDLKVPFMKIDGAYYSYEEAISKLK